MRGLEVKRSTKKATLVAAVEDLHDALADLAYRFPLEFKGFDHANQKCSCLQFEDGGYCRHLHAANVLDHAKKSL